MRYGKPANGCRRSDQHDAMQLSSYNDFLLGDDKPRLTFALRGTIRSVDVKKLSVACIVLCVGVSTSARLLGAAAWDRIIRPPPAAPPAPAPPRLAPTRWARRFRHPASVAE